MNCKHCGQEMEPGEETRRPSMCPNVAIFMDHCLMDTLTGKCYWADDNPIHCTDSHVQHIALVDKHIEAELNPKH